MNRLHRRLLAGAAALLLPVFAQAGFFQWEMVELPASTGASCGNGSPYRFFVNRTPFTRDTVIMYEGGGACWDQKSCLGEGKLSASNPDGIPPDYMTSLTTAAFGLVTPFTARIDPFQAAPTQSWNMVYVPYCTGDIHTGSALQVYADSDPANPRVQHFRGQANIRAAAQWLRANTGRPNHLLLTGFSAGGAGSTSTYVLMRDALQPTGRAQLLADSGPLFPAPRAATPVHAPSLPLHNKIRIEWGLDTPEGLITSFAGLSGFDTNDLGTVNTALAIRYPNDRFGFLLFRMDENFAAFSYEKFYPEIFNEPDPDTKKALINVKWRQDTAQWLPVLDALPNVGYHVAFWRSFNESHCLTIVDFANTGIEEQGIPNILPFIDNTLARTAAPMRNFETDEVSDYALPPSRAQILVTIILKLFG
ncbi:pectin acetylesterase-family hydrolase [Piscinibacter sp.]|uniref:pectin acetylesterase-family hydrolase n=1 Tax=Piscinibacter sp. TaxID=1903157 RepID=UPI002B6DD45F|nr:pectin acetylesterase-family hydrolase [Albitalea sp.]HUG25084.1 pectin acetylesterase-family hydrolase [Albitalea sp.]